MTKDELKKGDKINFHVGGRAPPSSRVDGVVTGFDGHFVLTKDKDGKERKVRAGSIKKL